MFGLSHWWFILLLFIVLIIFGPGKLPQMGAAIGQALREFRSAANELRAEIDQHIDQNEPPLPSVIVRVIDSVDPEEQAPSRAEPSGAEPSRAEPSGAEPSRAEPTA